MQALSEESEGFGYDRSGESVFFGRIPKERLPSMVGIGVSALGVVVIVLGWYGAAHTTILQYQTPYLISGGMLGAALIVLGGIYTSASTLVRAQQRVEDLLAEALDGLDDLPDEMPVPVRAARPLRAATSEPLAPRGSVMWVRGGASYHMPECQAVQGKTSTQGTVSQARRQGLAPCRMCGPPERALRPARDGNLED